MRDAGKTLTQRALIMELLRLGPVRNTELNEAVGYRYSARIFELRQAGHNIKTERLADGLFQFRLVNA